MGWSIARDGGRLGSGWKREAYLVSKGGEKLGNLVENETTLLRVWEIE